MMPLVFAQSNADLTVLRVGADDKTKKHLENMGILRGSIIKLISTQNGNVILKVKDGRVAINQSLASKIFVE